MCDRVCKDPPSQQKLRISIHESKGSISDSQLNSTFVIKFYFVSITRITKQNQTILYANMCVLGYL